MVRAAMAYALVFATAAGPWLCCCTAGHLTAAAGNLAVHLGLNEPTSGCCGHHARPERPPADRAGDRTDTPRPGPIPTKCPCRDHSTPGAVLNATDLISPAKLILRWLGTSQPLPSLLIPASARAAGSGDRDCSSGHEPTRFENPRDILSAFQILVC